MILLISIYAFLIFMGLLLKDIQKKLYLFHIEKDIINIRCSYSIISIVICVTCVYDILVYQILKLYLRFVLWQ